MNKADNIFLIVSDVMEPELDKLGSNQNWMARTKLQHTPILYIN